MPSSSNLRAESLPLLPQPAPQPAKRHLPAADSQSDTPSVRRGLFYMLLSAVCHALMNFQVHVAETHFALPPASAIIVRAVVSLSISVSYLHYQSLLPSVVDLPAAQLARLLARGVCGALGGYFIFEALARLEAGVALTLSYASPAITSVLAAVVLGDPFTSTHALALVANFAGVALVSLHAGSAATLATSHPASDALLHLHHTSAATATASNSAQQVHGVLFALAAACASSAVFVLLRRMGLQVHFAASAGAYGAGCALLAPLVTDRAALAAFGRGGWGLALAVGSALAGFAGQSLLARSLQNAPAGPAAVVRSVNVPIIFVLGLVFLRETVGAASLVGVALVLSSVVGTAVWQVRKSESK